MHFKFKFFSMGAMLDKLLLDICNCFVGSDAIKGEEKDFTVVSYGTK